MKYALPISQSMMGVVKRLAGESQKKYKAPTIPFLLGNTLRRCQLFANSCIHDSCRRAGNEKEVRQEIEFVMTAMICHRAMAKLTFIYV